MIAVDASGICASTSLRQVVPTPKKREIAAQSVVAKLDRPGIRRQEEERHVLQLHVFDGLAES